MQIIQDKDKLKDSYNKITYTSSYTCLAPKCSFYGKYVKRMDHHMDVMGTYPKGFHAFIQKNKDKSVDEIMKLFIKKYQLNEKDEILMGIKREDVIKYVEKLKQAYIKINN